ncbi:MAG TPA: hypothetical protein VM222_06825 [Planctomycetota bacterium]|nr:hypothetical protein [Planctomycetota bacterium]
MKQYRQDSHAKSLVAWAILCTATAIVLFAHSHKILNRVLKTEEILAGVALLVLGPAVLSVYLLRARKVWVSVDDGRGIVVSGHSVIAWEDILRVERKRPNFRKGSGPVEAGSFESDAVTKDLATATGGCADVGCLLGIGEFAIAGLILFAALFAIWLLCFVVVPLLLLPLLEVFAPFGDRIRIVTRRRGALVLRDLRDADEFVRRLSNHRPVLEG